MPRWCWCVGVAMRFANYGLRRLTSTAIAEVVAQLSSDAYRASVEHDLSFYDEFSSGKIVSRITSDTRDFGELVTLITDVASMTLESLILAVVLLFIQWKLTLYVFFLIPIVLVLALVYRKVARNATRQGMRAMANVNATIKETVSGIAVAKNFRQEASIFNEFQNANQTSYNVNVRRGLVLSVVFPTLNALSMIATALMVLAGMRDAEEANREVFSRDPFRGVSPFFGYYVLQARALAGDFDGCLDLIRSHWGGMLQMGATTFWEGFDIDWMEGSTRIDELPVESMRDIHADFGGYCYKGWRHSLCHGWAGGPAAWLSEHVLGVKPASPGFNEVRIEPHLGGLDWASGTVPTPFGDIEVEHRQIDGRVVSTVRLPDGVRQTG